MHFIELLFKKKSKADDRQAILNDGIHMMMTFGKSWQISVENSLGKKYPRLSNDELKAYNAICQDALKVARDIVISIVDENGQDPELEDFERIYVASFPWISQTNLKRLFSQGIYYAKKQ